MARVGAGARRAHRRDLSLGQGQLCAPRAGHARPRTSSPSCDRPPRRSEGHPHHDRQRARPRHLRGHSRQGPRPRLVQARRLLRGPRPLLPGQQRRRRRRPQGHHRQARLPAVAGRRLPLAAAVLQVPAAGRRLRRLRLHRRAARVRRPRRLRGVRRRRPPARHARHHRLRHEPHQRPAPVVPGVPQRPRRARTATTTSGPTTTSSTRTRGSSSSTPRPPTGPSTRSASSTTGTASSPTSRTSTTRTRPSRRRSSPPCGSGWTWASTASGWTRCRTSTSEEGTNCENLPATHDFLKRVRKEIDAALPGHGAAGRGQPVAGGRRRLLRRLRRAAATNATWRSTSRSCRASSWRYAANPATRSRRSSPRPRRSLGLPVGHLPAQPRRAHPRNGHRRRTRLHVRGVRQGPADARQHRHPPAARPAAGQRPQPDRAVHRPAAVPARLADPLLRRRDRHGRQHLARRPRRRPHPDAVDPRPQRRLLVLRPRAALPADDHGPGLRLPGHQRRGVDGLARRRCCTGPAG